jgi:hypothetical protein
MDAAAESILSREPHDRSRLAERVAALADETQLRDLMSGDNWDDGYEVPLAVVRHPRCDRALALRMCWALDDTAQIHHPDEDGALHEDDTTERECDPADFERMVPYCATLVNGLRDECFPVGRNSFDTGFFGIDGPSLTERQRKPESVKTKVVQRDHEDGFLRPGEGID